MKSLLQRWERNQVLITKYNEQQGECRNRESRAQPRAPRRACGFFHRYGVSGGGQLILSLLEEHGTSADIDGAFRAVEKMFFELVELVGLQFVEKIPFRCFQTHRIAVVHVLLLPLC